MPLIAATRAPILVAAGPMVDAAAIVPRLCRSAVPPLPDGEIVIRSC
jgi:hypothetical protein